MRIRRVLLGLAIFILATGIFLFASSTVRERHTSSIRSGSAGPGFGQSFEYSGETLTPDNPPQVIVGTTGMANLIILNTPFRGFSNYVCQHLPGLEKALGGCDSFGGGSGFNITILNSYLQTHKSQIVHSQIIVDENVTLDYPVTTRSDVTIVLAHMGFGIARDFWQSTMANQTLTYPVLGYTERAGTAWSLPNMSLALVAAGTVGLIVTLTQFKTSSLRMSRSYQGSATQKCSACDNENLFFAERCLHCGSILHAETPRAIAQ